LKLERVVDPTAPVEGVRFTLRRPAYAVVLLFAQAGERPGAARYQAVVQQTLDGEPLVYEARTRTNPFSATKLAISLEEAGDLGGLAAGEEDRSLELVASVAALAAPVAGLDLSESAERAKQLAARKPSCDAVDAKRRAWESGHRAELELLRRLEAELARSEAAPAAGSAAKPAADADPLRVFDRREKLLRSIDALAQALRADPVEIGDEHWALGIGAKTFGGGPQACIQVELRKRRVL
jgi:hypothetical protein